MFNLHIFLEISLSSNSQSSESFEQLLITHCIISNYNQLHVLYFCGNLTLQCSSSRPQRLTLSDLFLTSLTASLASSCFAQFVVATLTCCSSSDVPNSSSTQRFLHYLVLPSGTDFPRFVPYLHSLLCSNIFPQRGFQCSMLKTVSPYSPSLS